MSQPSLPTEDTTVASGISVPVYQDHGMSSLLIGFGATELGILNELRDKGWQNEQMTDHFIRQRDTADQADQKLNLIWMKRMRVVFGEINDSTKFMLSTSELSFLDLGCCPGGFASYVLSYNQRAIGFGISLPVNKGGHGFLLDKHLRSRFTLRWTDLTYYQLGPTIIDNSRLKQLPPQLRLGSTDLVILDGHQLRTQPAVRKWDADRLLISQIIIALQAVREGGNVVVKLARPECPRMAILLYMLDILCADLLTCKPLSMHSNRGTFYAVGKGVGYGVAGAERPRIVENLRRLWVDLTFGGDEGCGRLMTDNDLDFIASVEKLSSCYIPRIIELGRRVWAVQGDSLRVLLYKNGCTQ